MNDISQKKEPHVLSACREVVEVGCNDWMRGRVTSDCVGPLYFSKNEKFNAWAQQTVQRLRPVLEELYSRYRVYPCGVLNILGTYKVWQLPDDDFFTEDERHEINRLWQNSNLRQKDAELFMEADKRARLWYGPINSDFAAEGLRQLQRGTLLESWPSSLQPKPVWIRQKNVPSDVCFAEDLSWNLTRLAEYIENIKRPPRRPREDFTISLMHTLSDFFRKCTRKSLHPYIGRLLEGALFEKWQMKPEEDEPPKDRVLRIAGNIQRRLRRSNLKLNPKRTVLMESLGLQAIAAKWNNENWQKARGYVEFARRNNERSERLSVECTKRMERARARSRQRVALKMAKGNKRLTRKYLKLFEEKPS